MKLRETIFYILAIAYWLPPINVIVNNQFDVFKICFGLFIAGVFFCFYLGILDFVIAPKLSEETSRKLSRLLSVILYATFFAVIASLVLRGYTEGILSLAQFTVILAIIVFVLYLIDKGDRAEVNCFYKFLDLPEDLKGDYSFVKGEGRKSLGYSPKLPYREFKLKSAGRHNPGIKIFGIIELDKPISNKLNCKLRRKGLFKTNGFTPENKLSMALNSDTELNALIERINLATVDIKYGADYSGFPSFYEWLPNEKHITVLFRRMKNKEFYEDINRDVIRLFELIGNHILKLENKNKIPEKFNELGNIEPIEVGEEEK